MDRRIFLSLASMPLLGRNARAADPWPSRPISIVVPFVPGGPSDVLARALSAPMQAALGQPIVVDNRPGGGGSVSAQYVARATPDGHTLFVGASGVMTINPVLMPRPGYDPQRDFAPVTLAISAPNMLAVHPSVPAQNVAELVAWMKANPGAGSYGSSGVGSTEHLGMALFGLRQGLDLTHVPYRGGAAALTDLVAGTIKVSMLGASLIAGQVREGTLRAIASGGGTRHVLLPDVPTLEEAGLPGFRSESWHSIVAPAATPEPVLARLEAVTREALRQPAVAARLEQTGFSVEGTSRETLRARIASDLSRWAEVIRAAKVILD